jgi:hypothetical protein
MQQFNKLVENATRQAFAVEGNPLTLTFGSQTVQCFQGDIRKTKEQELGGFVQDYDAAFYCVKADFTTVPAEGDQVTVDSVAYRVVNTVTSTNDPIVQLQVTGVNR